jgi:hypothetical protein
VVCCNIARVVTVVPLTETLTNSVAFSQQANYLSVEGPPRPANLVPTFAVRGHCVVSITDPNGR